MLFPYRKIGHLLRSLIWNATQSLVEVFKIMIDNECRIRYSL